METVWDLYGLSLGRYDSKIYMGRNLHLNISTLGKGYENLNN